ncbi:MAG TPA: thiamine phosphate synthase [Lichenihabitans sp.]|jgi:thiamine-phosphate pyrophosphorylase|nr:thiamine phosphate synthase [Lichenihabitans sp.]
MADVRARLYLITPRIGAITEIEPQLAAALGAGDVACLLLRFAAMPERAAKEIAKRVAAIVQQRDTALLVEDARLAAHVGTDGVHVEGLGQAFADALDSMKPGRIVGVGAGLSRDEAMQAGEAGADYLMFDAGPGAAAETLGLTAWWAEIFNVPCVGVAHRRDEVEALGASGAEFVGLGDAVWRDPRGLAAVVGDAEAALVRAAARRGVPA